MYTGDDASPCEGDAQLLTIDDLTDIPPGTLTVTGMTPETIAVGRHEPYWLLGTGLSQVTWAVIGSSACQVVVYGFRLSRVIAMNVDTVACTVDETSADWLRATVPSLTGHEGQRLSLSVSDGTWASPHTDAHLTVEG